MSNSGESAKSTGALDGVMNVLKKTGHVLSLIGSWIFRLRKIILSIPVLYFAVSLALNNLAQLPEEVGIFLSAAGEFTLTVGKGLAVVGPLGVTAGALLLMFCSRKTLYPWVISVFSLILPVFILFVNTYPA